MDWGEREKERGCSCVYSGLREGALGLGKWEGDSDNNASIVQRFVL